MTRKGEPAPGAIAEAAKNAGGWVYEIGGGLDPDGDIPAAAIIGAWRVDEHGKIVGEFIVNPNYDAEKYPAGCV